MYDQQSIAESTYEGFVAWIDGTPVVVDGMVVGYDSATPLFEAIPHNPLLAQLVNGRDENVRFAGRQTVDWADVPHARVCMLELYAYRNVYGTQPIIRFMPLNEKPHRWIQFKRRSLVLQTSIADRFKEGSTGQSRSGISSWVIGYWWYDGLNGKAQVFEIPANGSWNGLPSMEFEGANHPCWPRPFGFAYSPHVLGLTQEEVTKFGAPPILQQA